MQTTTREKRYVFPEGASGGAMKGQPNIRGSILYNEPMSKHTTWRVGGPADRLFKPKDIDDVAQYLRTLDEFEPVM